MVALIIDHVSHKRAGFCASDPGRVNLINHHQYRTAFLVILVILISGCANILKITYNSDPPGAILYQGDNQIGYTPKCGRLKKMDTNV